MNKIVPHVGIFWRLMIKDTPQLLIDAVPLAAAEPYDEFLTYGGHDAFWTKLWKMSVRVRRQQGYPDIVQWSEYDEWPRGRVVYHQPTRRFTLYVDQKLLGATDEIAQRFGLPPKRTTIQTDEHYRSIR